MSCWTPIDQLYIVGVLESVSNPRIAPKGRFTAFAWTCASRAGRLLMLPLVIDHDFCSGGFPVRSPVVPPPARGVWYIPAIALRTVFACPVRSYANPRRGSNESRPP